MKLPDIRILATALCGWIACTPALHADPLAALATFSSIKDANLDKLAGGTVLAARGPAMSSPRSISVETLYLVHRPVAKTAELHSHWNPARHSELKVFIHSELPGKPTPGDFQRLASAPGNSSVKAFAAASAKLGSGGSGLQLSSAEEKTFPAGASGGLAGPIANFWAGVLAGRAQAFLSGGPGKLPPYDTGKDSVRAGDEISRLVSGLGKARGQFSALIDATPLGGGRGSVTPTAYWELSDIEGQAAVSLGASYSRPHADGWQAADIQYYASSGYYALVTLYQMWPVQAGGGEATLVWRGDFVSSASLASLKGVERLGSSTTMMRTAQKAAERLVKDAGK